MYTRADYLEKKCTHQEYYSQFVNESIKQIVLTTFSKKELMTAYEENRHFNTLKLNIWDGIAYRINVSMKEQGDFTTLAGKVCILKEAARQIVMDKI